MNWKTILAIYLLFWIMSAFLVLPFEARARGDDEAVAHVPGQEHGAPHAFRPGRIALRTTFLATALFALFYTNYLEGWVTTGTLDFFSR